MLQLVYFLRFALTMLVIPLEDSFIKIHIYIMSNYKRIIAAGGLFVSSFSSFAESNTEVKFKEGFYVGVSGGLAHHYGHRKDEDTVIAPAFQIANKDFSKNCATFGLHAGFLKYVKTILNGCGD